MRRGLYDLVRSLALGIMPEAEVRDLQQQHPELYSMVSAAADRIGSRVEEVTPDDFSIRVSKTTKIADWKAMSRVANFLKHAGRDSADLMSLRDLNNDVLLWRACAAYVLVSRGVTPEIEVFLIFHGATASEDRAVLQSGYAKLAETLAGLSPSRRRRACAKLVRRFKSVGRRSGAP